MFNKIKCLFRGHKFTNQYWRYVYEGQIPQGATSPEQMTISEKKFLINVCSCCEKDRKTVLVGITTPKDISTDIYRSLLGQFLHGGPNRYGVSYVPHPITDEGARILMDA